MLFLPALECGQLCVGNFRWCLVMKMVPITTYLLLLISSVFYIFWDAHTVIEEFTVQDRLNYPFSSFGYAINHHEYPLLL
ncbi:hypothetical protein VNO78_34280 [Psophocarpus tetragonolobus]|uniref:Uncharacterized protein n=1 Tax=Psophocarpus tetragonolobus TaxID=3891 RepID=A0AAN9NZ50_PSOTE